MRPRLTPGDLRRFRGVFDKEIARYLPGYDCATGPTPESELSAPLVFRGRPLGWASLRPKSPDGQASPEALALWPRMAEAALDKVALRKALSVDPETGLDNRRSFEAKLARLLQPAGGPRALRLWEGGDAPELCLAILEIGRGRRKELSKLLAAAQAARRLAGLAGLARAGDGRLAAALRLPPAEARAALDELRDELAARLPGVRLLTGYALHPQDLALDPGAPFSRAAEAAAALFEKAETALEFSAGRGSPPPVTGFGELVESCGRIVQTLPQNRVVLNLGRAMGALSGQVFGVSGEGEQAKGELTVFETDEDRSLAHVTAGRAGRLMAGDQLKFIRLEWSGSEARGAELEAQAALERQGFARRLLKLAQLDKPLALAVVRLDDHQRLAAMDGGEEVARRLELLSGEAAQGLKPELSAPWGAGSLALVWSGLKPEAAVALVRDLVAGLRARASFSAALIMWPSPVLKAEDLMEAARKTLTEAAMTGPGEVIVFGPQTLNISGDRLFDEGDLAGALEEYRRGLLLDPGHANLLNSLGVCHGRLGDQKAALAAFDEVLRLDDANLMAFFNKSCSLLIGGQLEEALEALARAEKLDPENFEVLFRLGKTALELGRLEQAEQALARAAALKGRRGPAHRLLGQARLLTGDRPGALAAFKEAVKFNPDDAGSLSALGALFLELANDQEVALSLLQRSVELDPTNSLSRQRLGRLCYDLGDFQAAEHHLKSALDYGCRSEDVRRQLASLAEQQHAQAPDDKADEAPASQTARRG
ncbi:MAG: tetratricopeptide repeat protein [Deltaproteobacteria bacterium]|nr:tetratricopeptide repeat protein [Deltaproteobacteria bacterium]